MKLIKYNIWFFMQLTTVFVIILAYSYSNQITDGGHRCPEISITTKNTKIYFWDITNKNVSDTEESSR